MKTKETVQKKTYLREIKQIYASSKPEGEREYVCQTRRELAEFYSSHQFTFVFLHNRYRKLKYMQETEGGNYLGFCLGLLPGIVTYAIDGGCDLTSATLFLIYIITLAVSGVICALLLEYVSKTYIDIFMTTKKMYIEPYEIELIKAALQEQHGFQVDSKTSENFGDCKDKESSDLLYKEL